MPEQFQITLPWPHKALNPNARGHWAKKARAADIYRYTCKMISLETIQGQKWNLQPLRDQVAAGGQIHVYLDFFPPNRRARDDDNIVAAFKSGRDGLSDALKIDDAHFRTHPFLQRDKVVSPGGEVVVTISSEVLSEKRH